MKQAITTHLLSRERRHVVAGGLRGGVTPRMWAILVDWMVEVQITFQLLDSSLFLAVDVLSRFLQLVDVPRGELQLVGAASLLIGSKLEETLAPLVTDFVYITADSYTEHEVIGMEIRILDVLQYRICSPVPSTFLELFAPSLSETDYFVAQFVLQLSLQNFAFLQIPPSLLAAGAISLAGAITGSRVWTAESSEVVRWPMAVVAECSALMERNKVNECHFELQLVQCRNKYAAEPLRRASILARNVNFCPPDANFDVSVLIDSFRHRLEFP